MAEKNNSNPDVYRVLSPKGRNLFRVVPGDAQPKPKTIKPSEKNPDDVFFIDAKLWAEINKKGNFPKMIIQNKISPKPVELSVPVTSESEPITPINIDDEDIELPIVKPAVSMPEFRQIDDIECGFFETQFQEPKDEVKLVDANMLVSRFNPHRPIFEFDKEHPAPKFIIRLGLPPSVARRVKRTDQRRYR